MIEQTLVAWIRERMGAHNKQRNGKLRFSVEHGRGTTYHSRDITVYQIDRYERSSVLAGRERRTWVCDFGEDTPQHRTDAEETIRAAGAWKLTDWLLDGGTTYVPIEQIVSHLPDDTDY
jgi:hypothetical protein